MRRWLYMVQQRLAITEGEARALGVVFFLLALGQSVQYGWQRWGVPDPVEPLYVVQPAHVAKIVSPDTADSHSAVHPSEPEEPEAGGRAQHVPRTPRPPGPVNVNTASQAELERLPGIGPAMAARIVEHRTKNGPFTSVAGLLEVKGIGKKKLEKLAPLVTVLDEP